MSRALDCNHRFVGWTVADWTEGRATLPYASVCGGKEITVAYGEALRDEAPAVGRLNPARLARRCAIDNGHVIVAPLVTASLSADHRASDGHRGALYLNELNRLLQEPEQLDEATR